MSEFKKPIREIDDRPIGSGTAGPVTKQIQKAYFELVKGQNAKYADFLDYL